MVIHSRCRFGDQTFLSLKGTGSVPVFHRLWMKDIKLHLKRMMGSISLRILGS